MKKMNHEFLIYYHVVSVGKVIINARNICIFALIVFHFETHQWITWIYLDQTFIGINEFDIRI